MGVKYEVTARCRVTAVETWRIVVPSAVAAGGDEAVRDYITESLDEVSAELIRERAEDEYDREIVSVEEL